MRDAAGHRRRGLRGRRRPSSASAPATAARSTATSSSSASASQPRTAARRAGRPRRRQRDPRRRAPADQRARACSPPATSPTPTTRSTASGSASSTGPTRSTRGRPPRATCSASADAYDRLPYFFSDQYDVGMEYSGFARDWDRVVFRGDPASREFIAFWLRDDRVVAGMNVNVWDVTDPIQRLIRDARRRSTTDASPTPTSRSSELVAGRRRRRGMNRLQALHDAGVSIWLDTLSRELLDSGAFARADRRLRGHRRDLEPDDLRQGDHRLRPLRRPAARRRRRRASTTRRSCSSRSRSTTSGRAADLLRPAYDASDGRDGFVSFECTPDLADDTDGHDRAGARAVGPARAPERDDQGAGDRRPGSRRSRSSPRAASTSTSRCCSRSRATSRSSTPTSPASSGALRAGRAGRRDRLGGLVLRLARRRQGRRAAARRLRRCAAASRSPTPAAPTPATASASPTSAGARCATPARSPQRPLWASTGTKDPAYSDVLYVEELIAPDVINTMPEATLRAFADHGDVTRALSVDARRGRARRSRRAARRGRRPRRHHRRARARRRALLLRLLPRAARAASRRSASRSSRARKDPARADANP